MASSEISISTAKAIRTALVAGGLAVAYLSLLVDIQQWGDRVFIVGLGLCTYGCYFWAKLKGRHWAWMLWGLLAPAGLVVLLLLKTRGTTPEGVA
jgi:hypothetical protein